MRFDLTASGSPRRVGWVGGNDGLLAMDRNADGLIDDGRELFGAVTPLPGGGVAGDGYRALAALDDNSDGRISSADAAFGALRVWVDADADGVSGTGELLGLVDLHITELNLDFLRTQRLDQGNLVGMVSSYTLADGQVREMADVWFRQENTPAAAPPPNLTELLVAPGAIGPALTDPGPQGPPAPAPVPPVPAAGPADDDDNLRTPPLV